jgi:L-lactate dehydrogenase complex protein LldG
MTSRERVLERIREATGVGTKTIAASLAELPRAYVHRGARTQAECVDLLVERLREYDAEVTQCGPGELQTAVTAAIAASGRQNLVAPAGLGASLGITADWTIDNGLTQDAIEQMDGVVTAATCAVADSGTIVLHHGQAEGRRVLTLLPDWHLCIMRESQVVETLPQYFAHVDTPPALVTWISGPSATADIEMTRIKGVHGPRFLHVVLVAES